MSKKTLEQFVREYNDEHGYDNSPESMYETFVECMSNGIVQKKTSSEHRWYDILDVVHKVSIDGEDRFFETYSYHITGDNSASDMDLDMSTLDDVSEVFPVKITKVVYQ